MKERKKGLATRNTNSQIKGKKKKPPNNAEEKKKEKKIIVYT